MFWFEVVAPVQIHNVLRCISLASKLAPTLLSVFTSRLSKGRAQSPQPGSPVAQKQSSAMGQQPSKKPKKGSSGKEKEKDVTVDGSFDVAGEENTLASPPESLSRASGATSASPTAVSSAPAASVSPPNESISSPTSGRQRAASSPRAPSPNPNGVTTDLSSLSLSTNSSTSPSTSPNVGPKPAPAPLDIPITQTILANSSGSYTAGATGFPTSGSASDNNAAGGEAMIGNGNGGGKDRLKSFDIDDMIQRLLDVGYTGKVSKSLCLKNAEIAGICQAAREVFLNQPTLIELSPPVKIVGDVHGQYSDLIRLFEMCGFPPAANYLFLGDYVDRGKQSLETILLLLCYKIKYPENFFLLRGNHECANVTRGERVSHLPTQRA